MRIAIDARFLRTSTGTYIDRLLHYLQKVDSQHDYLVLLKPEDVAGWQPTNKRFQAVACPHKEFTFEEQTGLLKQIKQLDVDLVHFGMTQQPIRYKAPKITTIHDLTTVRFNNPDKSWLIYKFKQMVYRFVIKSAARRSAYVITPSEYVRQDVAGFAKISPDKIVVTLEAADPIPHVESIPTLVGKKFIMYVGRPTPHKNLERLIKAFGELKKTYPDLLLVLAGKKDTNYQRIQSKIANKSYAKSIIFTDYVSANHLRWLYENCQVYVFPSLSEGFGLPGLEAMVHGAPVVSSNATCLPEVYGDAAIYFNPKDVHDMAEKISGVLSDNKLRQTLIAKGKTQAAKYSWVRMAKQTLDVYNKALSARKNP
jgi:glycosyltransferase involved in cell wall biosynthesis